MARDNQTTMNSSNKNPVSDNAKALTGIEGFDQITRGGLPRGKATLVTGGPGSGKTVFGLQTLANGVLLNDEPGIFVAFEENSRQIVDNAASFGWNLRELKELFFLDAMPASDTISIGEFDFSGMLTLLSAKVQAMNARRIVFDSLDVLLHLLPGPVERRREMNRLHSWLVTNGLTAVITAKLDWQRADAMPLEEGGLQYMPFIVDCVIVLMHEFENTFSQRRLRIMKYRGSGFAENEAPFIIGPSAFEVATTNDQRPSEYVSTERVSSGVEALDEMLGGGFIRGSTAIITGEPGTAKTTLSGAFAAAACQRGERTLYLAFDESGGEIVRNLRSVGLQLQSEVSNGLLLVHTGIAGSGSAEEQLLELKALVHRHRPTCMVIDPFSAFIRSGSELTTQAVAYRMIRWVKSRGITLLCTSLSKDAEVSGTILKISTVADTWIHLNFYNGGERNRALTIYKSRGTKHSNQVRELILSDSGVSVAAQYTGSGEMLMGTMRWEKERENSEELLRLEAEFESKRVAVTRELAHLDSQIETLQHTVNAKRLILRSMSDVEATRREEETLRESGIIRVREAKQSGSVDGKPPKNGWEEPALEENRQ
jgi:circadian clock protein KaiC